MARTTTNLNSYIQELTDGINGLSSISDCQIYGGEFDSDEDDSLVKMRFVKDKALAFVTFSGGPLINGHDNKMQIGNRSGSIEGSFKFGIFICASDDRRDLSHSRTATTAVQQVSEFLVNNRFETLGTIGFNPVPGELAQLSNSIRKGKRYSTFVFTYEQRMVLASTQV